MSTASSRTASQNSVPSDTDLSWMPTSKGSRRGRGGKLGTLSTDRPSSQTTAVAAQILKPSPLVFPTTVFLLGSSQPPCTGKDGPLEMGSNDKGHAEDRPASGSVWMEGGHAVALIDFTNSLESRSSFYELSGESFGTHGHFWESPRFELDVPLSAKNSASDAATPSKPQLIPAVPVPLSPGSHWIPDQATIFQFVDAYFTFADITLAMLHRGVFEASAPSTLLLSSILIVVPFLQPEVLPVNINLPSINEWIKSLFMCAKLEMLAFLVSGQPVTIEIVAAVVNIYVFSTKKGQFQLSNRLLNLAKTLIAAMGLVSDAETFEPPQELLTWTQTLEAAHGADVATRTMEPGELDLIKLLWIDYWVRERVTAVVLFLTWLHKDWARVFNADDKGSRLADLRRPIPPMMQVWKASIAGTLDPRTIPDPPFMLDAVSPLLMDSDDPARPLGLQKLTRSLVEERRVLAVSFFVLRKRVDVFLASCRAFGLESPALLPLDPAHADPHFLPLIERRSKLDDILIATRNTFPDSIKSGLRNGSVAELMAAMMENSGNFHYAFNNVLVFSAICLLHLELYSSCGTYLTTPAAVPEEDTIADEFAHGGELFAEFLQDVLQFTRMLEEWRQLNANFLYHVEPHKTLVFRVYCIHISFYKRFRAGLTSDPETNARTMEALSHVKRDIDTCLAVIHQYARTSLWARSAEKVARKMVTDQRISEVEMQEVWQRVDVSSPDAGSPGSEEAEIGDEAETPQYG